MSVPTVVIVGRPNVGKSSILNWLARKRISIVAPTEGVTRDRVSYLVDEADRAFQLVDTGGMGVTDTDGLTEDIEQQIDLAIREADLILFVVDGRSGPTALDRHVAQKLRRLDRPQLTVVNKCDSTRTDAEVHEFFALTNQPLVQTSVKANRNRKELLAAIAEHLPAETAAANEPSAEPVLKLAIVGRRNAGKSTFINALAKEERMIVSEVAGTTRDSVDVRFEQDDRVFLAIDTPGVRKRKSLADDVEYYGMLRAKRSIRRADVVLMVFDAAETISRVDKQLVDEIHRHYKPCVFVVNKWDRGQAAEMTMDRWERYLLKTFGMMRHVPVAFVTAQTGRNVAKVVNLAEALYKQTQTRVTTGPLNQVVSAAVEANPPPFSRNRRPKIFYATQVSTEPPTIVLKCNDPRLFEQDWKRYLTNALREELPFAEVPVKLLFRGRDADES